MTDREVSSRQTPLRGKSDLRTVWAHIESCPLTWVTTQGLSTSLAEDCPKIHMFQQVYMEQTLKIKRFRSILSPDTEHHLKSTRSITKLPWDHPLWRKASKTCNPQFAGEDSKTYTASLKTTADVKRLPEGVTGKGDVQLWEKWMETGHSSLALFAEQKQWLCLEWLTTSLARLLI